MTTPFVPTLISFLTCKIKLSLPMMIKTLLQIQMILTSCLQLHLLPYLINALLPKQITFYSITLAYLLQLFLFQIILSIPNFPLCIFPTHLVNTIFQTIVIAYMDSTCNLVLSDSNKTNFLFLFFFIFVIGNYHIFVSFSLDFVRSLLSIL